MFYVYEQFDILRYLAMFTHMLYIRFLSVVRLIVVDRIPTDDVYYESGKSYSISAGLVY